MSMRLRRPSASHGLRTIFPRLFVRWLRRFTSASASFNCRQPWLAGETILSGLQSGTVGCSGTVRFPLGAYRQLFGGIQDRGGLGFTPGGGPVPIDPLGPLVLVPEKRDVLLGLALTELADLASDEGPQSLL